MLHRSITIAARRNALRVRSHWKPLRGLFSTSLSSERCLVELVDGDIAILKLNNPPVNTFDKSLLDELTLQIECLQEDPRIRGLVITSNNKVFSAGLDLRELVGKTEEETRAFWISLEKNWATLFGSKLATAAAINGACPAYGAVLALSCDYRVMNHDGKALMGLNETQVGLPPPGWVQAICERAVGPREAERLLQYDHFVDAPQALKIGYVDETVASDEVVPAAIAQVRKMLKIPDFARVDLKSQQRKDALEKACPESVEKMVHLIMGDAFQTQVQDVMRKLADSSARKKQG